jgi:hypothetical protein
VTVPRPEGAGWQANTGRTPNGAAKRVRVVLRTGREPNYDGNAMSPPGWAVDTTRWSITGHPYDVAWYLPL